MSRFIGSWYLNDISICDSLIDYHNSNPNKSVVNVSYKSCEETYINLNDPPQCVENYVRQLESVCDRYKERYAFCNEGPYWAITEGIKIQKYNPCEAYHGWHFERDAVGDKEVRRHLAFMTYLNTVEDAGETEFYYQYDRFKPRKGLTLIWPAEWTHTHRGIPSLTETKYILTGWYNYY
jgi:hypothetical protein